MTSAALFGFVAVALAGVLTPGLDTMLVIRYALLGGRQYGFLASVGIALGCLVWGTASVIGLTALLTASDIAYQIVRLAGAAYLIWLGGTALWNSLPGAQATSAHEPANVPTKIDRRSCLRSGLLTNLLNPKVGVFYMSLLPQFIPTGAASGQWGAVLVAMHIGITLVWLPSLVWVAGHARAFFAREKVRRWMDRVTASVLIALGIRMATQ